MKKNVKLTIASIIVIALGITTYFGTKNDKKVSIASVENSTATVDKGIIVGTTGQTFPNTYYDKNDKLTGFDIEVTEEIAKKLGYDIKWEVIGDVPGLLTAVDSGKIDTVANAVTVLPARQEIYDFSNTVGYYAAQIAVKTDSDYQTVKDLEGKTVSATLGSSNVTLLEAYNSKVNIQTYDDRSAVFSDANNGKVDGVLNQRQFLQQTIKDQGLDLRIIDENIGWNEAAYPFAKTDEATLLREEFNSSLKELAEDGTLEKLSDKYFGENITKQEK